MSDQSIIVQEVRVLWNGFIENELDQQQKQRLDELVTNDRDARAEYIGLMNMHCTLSRYLSPSALPGEMVPGQEVSDSEWSGDVDLADLLALEDSDELNQNKKDSGGGNLIFDFLQKIPGYFSNNTFQIFVLLALMMPSIFVFLTVLNSSYMPVSENVARQEVVPSLPAPVIAKTVLADWEEPAESMQAGSYLTEGLQYTLLSGFAEIQFPHDARVVVQGPATFVATSHQKVQLQSGRCVAHVPSMASGFTIEANNSEIVDLGTEFGVETDSEKETEVYVFQGKVELAMKDAPLKSKIELTTNQGVHASGKTGVISKITVDTDRFVRTLDSDEMLASLDSSEVLASLDFEDTSFEVPNFSGRNGVEPNGTQCGIAIPSWNVGILVSREDSKRVGDYSSLRNPDTGYYLWSPQHGPKAESGVTDGNQACVLTLRDGTAAGTKPNKAVWIYRSLGRIRRNDVGHTLAFIIDALARTSKAEEDATITVSFATEVSAKNSGSPVGAIGTATGSEIWKQPQKLKASFAIPVDMVGKELFVVIRVEDDSPGSGEDLYLFDNIETQSAYGHP